jgi:hypothetical protein
MRLLALLVAIAALSQPATAQTPNCKTIPQPAARLACYDKAAAASASAEKSATAKATVTAPTKPPVTTDKYVDSIDTEEAVVNEHLKNICRGC